MFGFVCPTREKRVIIHSFIEIITYGETGNFEFFAAVNFFFSTSQKKSTTRLDGQLKSVKEAKK
jgi:hypothetical protein